MKSEKSILFCGVGIGQFLEFSISISKKGRREGGERRNQYGQKTEEPMSYLFNNLTSVCYATFFFFSCHFQSDVLTTDSQYSSPMT